MVVQLGRSHLLATFAIECSVNSAVICRRPPAEDIVQSQTWSLCVRHTKYIQLRGGPVFRAAGKYACS